MKIKKNHGLNHKLKNKNKKSMLTDAILCSSIAELLVIRLLGAVAVDAILVSVNGMAATFGKNAFSAAIDDKSVLLSITSPVIDVEHEAVEDNSSSALEAAATLTLLWLSGKLR